MGMDTDSVIVTLALLLAGLIGFTAGYLSRSPGDCHADVDTAELLRLDADHARAEIRHVEDALVSTPGHPTALVTELRRLRDIESITTDLANRLDALMLTDDEALEERNAIPGIHDLCAHSRR